MAGTEAPPRRVDGARAKQQLLGAIEDVGFLIADSVEMRGRLAALHESLFGEEAPAFRDRREERVG